MSLSFLIDRPNDRSIDRSLDKSWKRFHVRSPCINHSYSFLSFFTIRIDILFFCSFFSFLLLTFLFCLSLSFFFSFSFFLFVFSFVNRFPQRKPFFKIYFFSSPFAVARIKGRFEYFVSFFNVTSSTNLLSKLLVRL